MYFGHNGACCPFSDAKGPHGMRIKLERNGPEVSRIALGLMRSVEWGLSTAERLRWIKQAMELGLTTFDHADIYGDYTCEELFGEAISSMPSVRREMQLVTKCGVRLVSKNNPGCEIKHYDTSRSHIVASVENSLRRLRTDYIDLLLIHRPDPLMDPDEVAETFSVLRESGKVLFFGVSNFNPSQFEVLSSRVPFTLVTNQIECSVLETGSFEDGTLDMCQRLGIAPMAWSPLGGGALFGGRTKQILRVRKELRAVCNSLGIDSMEKLALAWLLKHPARIVPVIGTGRMDRIEEAVEAMSIELTREGWFGILRASRGDDVP
jgi:predicted oxidoreductase